MNFNKKWQEDLLKEVIGLENEDFQSRHDNYPKSNIPESIRVFPLIEGVCMVIFKMIGSLLMPLSSELMKI